MSNQLKMILSFCVCSLCIYPQTKTIRTLLDVTYFNSNYALGTGILGVGDINRDGNPDLAVSAGNIGETFFYFGGKGKLDAVIDLKIKGGGKIAKGDLNGDTLMDLIVQSKNRSSDETLFVYLGTKIGPYSIDTIPSLIISRESSGGGESRFGYSFSTGDINNDGYADIIVSAPNFNYKGKVYVYMGKSILQSNPDFAILGDSLCSEYGYTVSIGDLNDDGYGDVVIGSDIRSSCSDYSNNTIEIYYGKQNWSMTKNNYSQRITSKETGIYNLFQINLLDVNSDGFMDISVTDSAKAYFFYGQNDTIMTLSDFIIESDTSNFSDKFYWPAVDIGDINNDGRTDFVLRASPGGPAVCIYVFLGNEYPGNKGVAARCIGSVHQNTALFHVSKTGDMNGDKISDFAATVPYDAYMSIPPQNGEFIIFSGDTSLVTSIEQLNIEPVNAFTLSQNYPNPFNPETTIEYILNSDSFVKITIYDSAGREVRDLVNEWRSSGNHIVKWDGIGRDGSKLASGIYYYQLLSSDHKEIRKAILLK